MLVFNYEIFAIVYFLLHVTSILAIANDPNDAIALLLAHSESILHILLTIQDFSVYSFDFLMESDRAVQQRQQAKN